MATQVSSSEPVGIVGKSLSSSPTGKLAGPTYGSICIVCNDIAPTTSAFRRHYGVICCEACKCFFRRTVQMGREYKCRFGNNCPVGRSAVSMKQVCQACRFGQCIRSGMKMDCELMHSSCLLLLRLPPTWVQLVNHLADRFHDPSLSACPCGFDHMCLSCLLAHPYVLIIPPIHAYLIFTQELNCSNNVVNVFLCVNSELHACGRQPHTNRDVYVSKAFLSPFSRIIGQSLKLKNDHTTFKLCQAY